MQEQMEAVFSTFHKYSRSSHSLHDGIFELSFQIGRKFPLHAFRIFDLCISGYFVHYFGGGQGEEARRDFNLGFA